MHFRNLESVDTTRKSRNTVPFKGSLDGHESDGSSPSLLVLVRNGTSECQRNTGPSPSWTKNDNNITW